MLGFHMQLRLDVYAPFSSSLDAFNLLILCVAAKANVMSVHAFIMHITIFVLMFVHDTWF